MIDGDTFELRGECYRFAGLDTPGTQPGRFKCIGEKSKGDLATAALKQMINDASFLIRSINVASFRGTLQSRTPLLMPDTTARNGTLALNE